MTSKGKCIFNILLRFMLVLGLIPAISLTSHAVETPAGSVKQNFEVKAQADEVINVKIDVGSGHASLFDETALMNLAKATGASTATINENLITLAGIDSTTTEDGLRDTIGKAVDSLKGQEDWIIHNKELFGGAGYKPLADYQTYQEFSNDIENEKHNNPVKDDLTYYLLWGTAYSEVNLGSVNVICGQEAESNMPKTPAGTKLDDETSYWYEKGNGTTETFEGGKEYIFKASVTIDPDGDYWGYFFDENNLKVSVPGREVILVDVDEPRLLIIRFKATADHDWDEGKVTKEATTTAEGVKTYTCKTKGCGATKTEVIPKVEPAPAPTPAPVPTPAPAKISGIPVAKMTAKGSNSMTISWDKIQGVEGYDIYFAKENSKGKKASCKLVKNVTGNNTFKWTKSDLKKKTPYKAYVKAYITKDGKKTYVKTSPTIYAYTSNGTKEYTNAKSVTVKKTKVSLKKGKTYKISAKVNKIKKGKKLMPKRYAAALRYMTSNSKVATVSKKGKITAKGKGTCDIYVYAHNGVHKQIEVTVK